MLTLEKRSDGWWIVGVPPYVVDDTTHCDCGPYKTKVDADADRRGLERFYRRERKEVQA